MSNFTRLCVRVLSWFVLVIGTAAIIGAIVTPWWTTTIVDLDGLRMHKGLWASCTKLESETGGGLRMLKKKPEEKGCLSRLEKIWPLITSGSDQELHGTIDTRNVDLWELAVLALMCTSALFGSIAVVFAPCCCRRWGCCLGIFILVAALFASSGLGVFVHYTVHDQDMDVAVTTIAKPLQPSFSYSFYVACAGALCQFVTAILFCLARSRNSEYTGI